MHRTNPNTQPSASQANHVYKEPGIRSVYGFSRTGTTGDQLHRGNCLDALGPGPPPSDRRIQREIERSRSSGMVIRGTTKPGVCTWVRPMFDGWMDGIFFKKCEA